MLTHDDYTVGWISALPLEMAAAQLLLDQVHPDLPQPARDCNTYVLGEIAGHNVVIACLPSGVYGTTSAGAVAQHMLSTFSCIRFGMMVGIGGGVPSESADIRLGDVVVSKPIGVLPGVVQYDYGKTIVNGQVERTGTLNRPPQSLLTALSKVESRRLLGRSRFERYVAESLERTESSTPAFKHPGRDEDKLYNASLNLPRIECFVGRDKELAEVYKQLRSPNSTGIVTLHGLGGIGKTQLAAAYALRHRHEYSAIFWFDASDVTKLVHSFLAAARRIRLDHNSFADFSSSNYNNDPFKGVKAVKDWLNQKHNLHWLLIFDDHTVSEADRPRDEGNTDLKSCLPEVLQGHVLITTRLSDAYLGHRVKVRKLEDPRQGLEVLSASLNRPNIDADPYAHELTKELDGVPLALASAAAYMSQIGTSPRDYLQLYRDSWHRLQESSPQLPGYERSMHSTWSISYSQISAQNNLSCLLLEYWVFLDCQDLWHELLDDTSAPWTDSTLKLLSDQITFNQAIRVLCAYGMAEVNPYIADDRIQSQSYRLNKCVHSWAFDYLRSGQRSASAWRVLYCVVRYTDPREPVNQRVCQRLVPHANRLLQLISNGTLLPDRESIWVVGLLPLLYKLYTKASERISLGYTIYLTSSNVDYFEKRFFAGSERPHRLAVELSTMLERAYDLWPIEKEWINKIQFSSCIILALRYDIRLGEPSNAKKWYKMAFHFRSKRANHDPNDWTGQFIRLRIKTIWVTKHLAHLFRFLPSLRPIAYFIFFKANLLSFNLLADVVALVVYVSSWSALEWGYITPWKALCLVILSKTLHDLLLCFAWSPTDWIFYALSIPLCVLTLVSLVPMISDEILSKGSSSLQ
ncbi:hypothetical protein ABOM_007276 [Aspergillus bombycis]|uniref:NB-ARC domain-containing protein n=1 Tax=Aspergillus bombycis TaxID=109264 RepID=A0A1F7ZX79_9EURO|nr:hypothetical protein ABOM_007276 [Aspergillus bombycis]OGM44082.1 hypothetical protein ABOM_007276 [Aspergillus bombycis]